MLKVIVIIHQLINFKALFYKNNPIITKICLRFLIKDYIKIYVFDF